MLVDSHCHLDYLERDGDLMDAILRARAAGIHTMVTICTKINIKKVALQNVGLSIQLHINKNPTNVGNI